MSSSGKDFVGSGYDMADVNYLYGEDMTAESKIIPAVRAGAKVAELVPITKGVSTGVTLTKNVVKEIPVVDTVVRHLENDPAKLPPIDMSLKGNVAARKITENGLWVDLPKESQPFLKALEQSTGNKHIDGYHREVISDHYFLNNGFNKMEGKCGVQCFDGVYTKNGEYYVVEVKPLQDNGSIKLSDNSDSLNKIGTQMTDEWIDSRIKKLENSGSKNGKLTAGELSSASENNIPINKIVVGVNQDGAIIINLGKKMNEGVYNGK